jgi:F420 biosynthesis protein FbiB-like protein
MTSDQILAAHIGTRRSVRDFRPQPIERALIARLIAAAIRAPSAHNRQPWRFVVLDDDASKCRLAEAMGERLRHDRLADGADAKAIDADVARSHARITGAPAVVVVCVDLRDTDRYPDDRRNRAEYLMAVQSTAMAVQNLLLAAQSEGLGACVMCAPLFCPDTVADALRFPREWTAQMLVTIGAPAGHGRDRARLPLDEVVRWPPHWRAP